MPSLVPRGPSAWNHPLQIMACSLSFRTQGKCSARENLLKDSPETVLHCYPRPSGCWPSASPSLRLSICQPAHSPLLFITMKAPWARIYLVCLFSLCLVNSPWSLFYEISLHSRSVKQCLFWTCFQTVGLLYTQGKILKWLFRFFVALKCKMFWISTNPVTHLKLPRSCVLFAITLEVIDE